MPEAQTTKVKFYYPPIIPTPTAIRLCRILGYILGPLTPNSRVFQLQDSHHLQPLSLKMDRADTEIADFVALFCVSHVIRIVGNKRFDTNFSYPDEGTMGNYKHNVIHHTAHTFLDRVGDETDEEMNLSLTQIGKNRRRLFSIWQQECKKYERHRVDG